MTGYTNTHRVTYTHPRTGAATDLHIRVTSADDAAMAWMDWTTTAEVIGCARIADVHHVSAERAFQLFQSVQPLVSLRKAYVTS